MSVVIDRGYVWVAERDRIAHAHIARGRATRTVCGQPAIDPRYGHPAATRCPACVARIDGVAA